jgi:DNA-binding PucR family transcriptional regulator
VIAICQLATAPSTASAEPVHAGGRPPNGTGRAGPPAREAAAADDGDEDAPSSAATLDRLLRTVGDQVFAAASADAGGTVGVAAVSGGLSRSHPGLASLPAAAREAREAVRIGRRVYGAGHLVAFADLGLYRVLHSLRDTPELASFYEQTLGPLAEYDRRAGQNLVETLEAYFAAHGNLSETAQRLVIHRNTLLYRIRRIQEVGSIDLEDPEARLSLQVALKAKRLLA